MSALAQQAEEYLRLRRALGHELAEAARLLPRFVAYLDDIGVVTVTVDAALAWSLQPDAARGTSLRARRMTVARGFARHMAGIDPGTQVPPLGLVSYCQRWRRPFIYSPADIDALMAEATRTIPSVLRAATYRTLIGLLAASGMRVGEALRLQRSDLDWADGVATVYATKFGKSRALPLAATTMDALASYARKRHQHEPRPHASTFFVSTTGTPVIYADFGYVFRRLVQSAGIGSGSSLHPRIHDLRH
jgi:integrase